MGRAKVDIKYRENGRTRRSTYTTRMKGLEKKARELSVLCGVDVLFASSSPDIDSINVWPKRQSSEFYRISDRLRCSRSKNGDRSDVSRSPSLSPLQTSSREEVDSLNAKLKEVRERICFLQSSFNYSSEDGMASSQLTGEEPLKTPSPSTIPSSEDNMASSQLTGEDPLQASSPSTIPCSPLNVFASQGLFMASPITSYSNDMIIEISPSNFDPEPTVALNDLDFATIILDPIVDLPSCNMISDISTSPVLSSPSWSFMPEWNWCDSLEFINGGIDNNPFLD